MLSKQDFENALKEEYLKNDNTAALWHAQDPRLLQLMKSQATMLAMLSSQIELAKQEPFLKAREATVLADAANKGLLFTAKPCTVLLNVENTDKEQTLIVAEGRILLDSVGRYYQVVTPLTLAPQGKGTLKALQLSTEVDEMEVKDTKPFYKVEVKPSTDGSFISQLVVKVNGKIFTPSYKFNNVQVGERVFHVESDEFKRLFVKF